MKSNAMLKAQSAPVVPEFVIHEYTIPSKQDVPNTPLNKVQQQSTIPVTAQDVPKKSGDLPTEDYFEKLKPKSGIARSGDNLNLPGAQNPSPKSDDIFDGFHVFAWLNSHPKAMLSPPPLTSPLERSQSRNRSSSTHSNHSDDPATPRAAPEIQWSVEEDDINDDLREVDEFLKNRSSVGDRVIYQECALGSRGSIIEQLTRVKTKLMTAEKTNPEKLKILGVKEAIAAAADQVFQFFLPITFDGPTVQKFWGAIDSLILVGISDQKDVVQQLTHSTIA